MRNILILNIIFLLLLSSCGNKKNEEQKKTNIFQQIDYKITLKKNQLVLAPSKQSYDSAIIKGPENSLFVFYPRYIISETENTVKLNEYGDTVELPKSLIIPLDTNKKVAKGQYILTWWQKGTGMQRAVVLNKDSSYTPFVYYFDNQYSYLSPLNEINFWTDTLIPNSYLVLENKLMPGISIKKKDDNSTVYIVISYDNDKILALSWAGTLEIINKNDYVISFPYKKLSVGDSILIPYVGLYSKASIQQMWKDIGKIKVKINFYDTTLISYGNIADAIPIK